MASSCSGFCEGAPNHLPPRRFHSSEFVVIAATVVIVTADVSAGITAIGPPGCRTDCTVNSCCFTRTMWLPAGFSTARRER